MLALLLVTSTVLAEPRVGQGPAADSDPSFSFVWAVPAGCPERAEVLRRAERLIGHRLSRAAGAQPIELDATVRSLPNAAWQLSVSSGSRNEATRAVSAGSCDELADAMALLIALSLDPDYAARSGSAPISAGQGPFVDGPASPEAAPAPAVTVPPRAPSPAVAVVPSADEARSAGAAPRIRVALGALAAVWVGRLPGAAAGGVLRAALFREMLVLNTELGLFPAQRVTVPGGSADLSLITLGGSLGYALFEGLLTPYAGLELDRLHGDGTAVETSASGSIWLLGVDAGLRVAFPVRALVRVVLDAHVSALAQQARFHFDPDSEVFRPFQLGAQLGLGAEIRVR
jgi:hypothetical protein